MPEKEKKNIKDKEKELKEKEKEIASDLKAEAAEIDKSLSEVIREQATEDEAPQSRTFSLRKILGGDILSTSFMRRQIWLFLLIALFIVVYIANRYSCQQDIIEIDALQKELKDAKYKALSSNSKLTEESRQSNVLDMLKENKDSTLKLPTQPPYIITVPDK
ncbi:MAG: FtsL-like putative cell division protein [Prevotella sp.]